MTVIRNVFCVGRNYVLHAQELGNQVPTSPMLFLKPTHALVPAEGTVQLPGDKGAVHYEVEWVVHISRSYEKGLTVDDMVDSMALGIDFTLRDVQTELKQAGHPWLLAKGFWNSAPTTRFLPFEGIAACQAGDFSLLKNDIEVQRGNISQMLFDLQTIIEYTAHHFGLGAGDVIFTGTPAGVGPVADRDRFTLRWKEENVGEFIVSMV